MKKPRVMELGNIVHTGNWENPQRGRIYSPEGVAPCCNTVGGRLRDEDSGDSLSREYLMWQRVGDRDKVAFSVKPYAFTIASNPMSDRLQKVIEIRYEDNR